MSAPSRRWHITRLRPWRTLTLLVAVVAVLAALAVSVIATVPHGLRGDVAALRIESDDDNVLRGRVVMTTVRPSTVTLEVAADGHRLTVAETVDPAAQHEIPLLQLRPGRTYRVGATITPADGGPPARGRLGTFTTGDLPDDLPPVTVEASQPARMSPGLTMFNSLYRPPALDESAGNDDVGYLTVVDAAGQVVWYHRQAGNVQDATRLPDGNLLTGLHEVGARLLSPDGRPLHEWRGTAPGAAPDEVGEGLLPGQVTTLDVHSVHHEVSQLPDGRLLGLTRVSRELGFEDPPCEDTAAGEPQLVVGDAVVVWEPATGEVVEQHDLFGPLSPTDDGPPLLEGDFCNTGYLGEQYPSGSDPRDWTHANAVVPIDDGRTWLVSLRNRDSLVALRAVDEPGGPAGSLRWELGPHSDTFEMVGDGRWFWHQHAPELQEDGSILLYDNGNGRTDAAEPYSRAVRYQIDPEARTIEQVWEHRMDPDVFAGFVGDADRLDGTVLVTHGGRVSPCRAEGATDDDTRIHSDLVEVDEATGEVVFHVQMADDEDCEGWGVYRAERIPTVYPPAFDVTVHAGE